MSFGDAGPDATAMTVSEVIAQINGMLRAGLSERVGARRGLGLPGAGGLGALLFFFEG